MTFKLLILCTHNSARSLLAESMLNHWAQRLHKDVRAFSAGSAPSGQPNPFALESLHRAGIDTRHCRSKSWDEFTTEAAPALDVVITVCDRAAAEVCPVFSSSKGQAIKTHWGYADPSNAEGMEARRLAFELTRQAMGYRMLQLLDLPLAAMSRPELQKALTRISNT